MIEGPEIGGITRTILRIAQRIRPDPQPAASARSALPPPHPPPAVSHGIFPSMSCETVDEHFLPRGSRGGRVVAAARAAPHGKTCSRIP